MTDINLSRGLASHSQRNNKRKPMETCNTTSLTMGLKYVGVKIPAPPGVQEEDYLTELSAGPRYIAVRDRQGAWAKSYAPNEVWAVLEVLANDVAGRQVCEFRSEYPLTNIVYDLSQGKPFIVSTKLTAYGHIVCMVGFKSKQDWSTVKGPQDVDLEQVEGFYVDDPYGDWHAKDSQGRRYASEAGNDRWFTTEEVMSLFNAQKFNKKLGLRFV